MSTDDNESWVISQPQMMDKMLRAREFAERMVAECDEDCNFYREFSITVRGDIVTVKFTRVYPDHPSETFVEYAKLLPDYTKRLLRGDARVELAKYFLRNQVRDLSFIKTLADEATDEEVIDAIKALAKRGEI